MLPEGLNATAAVSELPASSATRCATQLSGDASRRRAGTNPPRGMEMHPDAIRPFAGQLQQRSRQHCSLAQIRPRSAARSNRRCAMKLQPSQGGLGQPGTLSSELLPQTTSELLDLSSFASN